MPLNRREFIKSTVVAGGGLALGFNLQGCGDQAPFPAKVPGSLQPNAFIQLTNDNRLILQLHKIELGQGVSTGMATLIAEELGVPPSKLELEFAQVHKAFGVPVVGLMLTGGSVSLKSSYETVRQAGAMMRELLLSAGEKYWRTTRTELQIKEDRTLSHRGISESVKLAELIPLANGIELDYDPPLTAVDEFRFIGKEMPRVDSKVKINGSAKYCGDLQVPEALVAVVTRCPYFGGKVRSFDASEAKSLLGVREVIAINSGIAIVADHYYQAKKALSLLKVEWDKGSLAGVSSEDMLKQQTQLLETGERDNVRDDGNYEPHSNHATISSQYFVPLLAHATMEPQVAIADVSSDDCTIWAPNQSPDILRALVADFLQRDRESIAVHSTWVGGGFGRRIIYDYVLEAVQVSAAVGKPVKLQWSREDDIRHDCYRPSYLSNITAHVDNEGSVKSWQHVLCGPSTLKYTSPSMLNAVFPSWAPASLPNYAAKLISNFDFTSYEGAKEVPYSFEHINLDFIYHDPGVPLGVWRSVGHSHTAFVVESFVDEIAHTLNQDPLDFRLNHLDQHPKRKQALSLAAEKFGWQERAQGDNNRYFGVAVHESFFTTVAQIAEISVVDDVIRVHRVVCAVDCGLAVNPDIVRAQMESGIIFGLTAALYGEITIEDGAVVQSNFHDYRLLRMNEAPEIEVYIVPSAEPPTGVGEPGVPPIAPAVANAVFMATGKRLRRLPLQLV